MAEPFPNTIAWRDGIGARLLELGFKRTGRDVYTLEDKAYIIWGRSNFIDHDLSHDFVGVISKELDRMIDEAGLDISRHALDEPAKAHVYRSAIEAWDDESRASAEAFRAPLREWSPIYWFYPWIERWKRQDPFTQCPFTRPGAWYSGDDPAGCAAASLAQWRRIVEPWLAHIRDPATFAAWYEPNRHMAIRAPTTALAWARAGDRERAKRLLHGMYSAPIQSIADSIEQNMNLRYFRQRYRRRAERLAVVEALAHDMRKFQFSERERAKQTADYLEISLDD